MTVRNLSIIVAKHSTSFTRTFRKSVYPADKDTALTPVSSLSLVPVEHVLRKGFPYEPLLHVTSDAYLSADGSFVDAYTYPWEAIFNGAHSRFVAMENLWDSVGGRWDPLYTEGVDYYFSWPLGGVEPRLEDIEYRIGNDLHQVSSIRIEEETSLTSSFNAGMDDATVFMISMAGVINSSERASLLRVGNTMGDSIEVSVDEKFYLRNQFGTGVLQHTIHPARMVPFYLVLISEPNWTELRVSTGGSHIARLRIPNTPMARQMKLVIGEDLSAVKALSMNLFEVTLFPYGASGTKLGGNMTPEQIIAAMSSVYGSY